jgi:integrase
MNTWGEWPPATNRRWPWPIPLSAYNRSATLRPSELAELRSHTRLYEVNHRHKFGTCTEGLQRLVRPLRDVMDLMAPHEKTRSGTINVLLRQMFERRHAYWGWSSDEWIETLDPAVWHRPNYMAVAYLLTGFTDFHSARTRIFRQVSFAMKIFGSEAVWTAVKHVQTKLSEWGHAQVMVEDDVPRTVCETLLVNRSPFLEDLTPEVLERLRVSNLTARVHRSLVALSEVLASDGIFGSSLPPTKIREPKSSPNILESVPPEWVKWCQRWRGASTRSRRTLRMGFYWLLHVGRWIARQHPEADSPGRWTTQLAVECVAAIHRMRIGEWAERRDQIAPKKLGKPIAAGTIASRLGVLRAFFADLQEWELIPRKFDSHRCFRTPRSVRARLGPSPRVLADDIWAKLLWAGLNLTEDDLPRCRFRRKKERRTCWYPLKLVRALVMVWLFAGLRRDEIQRMRVGCVRWQPNLQPADTTGRVCFLDIPVSKTADPFTKPVDGLVGQAIEEWERERPVQPRRIDAKTGEIVDFLFLYRAKRVGPEYLNKRLIPALCRKAGIPTRDVRGNITSHRARSTIASQLFNARDPMSLFELQQWLGHRSPASTQHYVQITPTKLAQSYSDAGYFQRNLRRVEVLIDADVVKAGAAGRAPWMYYDLAHGYCTYDFFDQCPHRMACAKCAFYRPKASTETQLVEGKVNFLRLQQAIPLRDEEIAAVEDGISAIERLLTRLIDIPTPAGPTPRQLQVSSLIEIGPVPKPEGQLG